MKTEEKLNLLPEDLNKEIYSIIDVLVHNYTVEKEIKNFEQEQFFIKKNNIIKNILSNNNLEELDKIEIALSSDKKLMTDWEKGKIEEGLQDMEAGRVYSHKDVMKEIRGHSMGIVLSQT